MRKRTRRKHYQATTPAIAFVIDGVRPIDDEKARLLLAAEHLALDAFRAGTATQTHWRTIADVVNLSETLARMGVGRDEVSPVLAIVEQHLGDAHAQFLRTNQVATTPEGLQAMVDLVEYHPSSAPPSTWPRWSAPSRPRSTGSARRTPACACTAETTTKEGNT